MQNNLPRGWVECEIEDLSEVVSKGATPKNQFIQKGYAKFLKAENITKNSIIDLTNCKYINKETHTETLKRSVLKNNDVLITIAGTLGKCAVVDSEENININQAICFVRLYKQCINPYFLKYYILSPTVQRKLTNKAKVTAIPNLTLEIVKKISVSLPPFNEQQRIVEKIESEFEKIDKGIEHLTKVQEQIKQYRQSVLKSAFDGKLYKTTESEETTLENITEKIGDVDHKMPKEVKDGIPYISPKDFYGVNDIDFKNAKKISIEDYKLLSKKIIPEKDDIIFPRYGTIGVLRYVNTDNKFLVSYSCAIIKTCNKKADSKYIYYYLLSPQIKTQILKSIRQTTQANIGMQSIKDFKIKKCSLDEQQKIVKEIEKRFKVADEVEKIVDNNLEKAKQLKQSILKKAFEGRLVPQDPNDEPASVLLEKIKAERKLK